MKKASLSLVAILLLAVFGAGAHAHSVWINSFESRAHHATHTMLSIGWGHSLPMDDILTSPTGRIAIQSFELIEPDLTKTDLLKPGFKVSEPDLTRKNFELFAADLATQKVAFKQDSQPGVYQFSAASVPTYYTKYIDKNGKTRLKLKPVDQVEDAQKVLMSIKYQAFAKTCITLGKWSRPEPLGHGIEIIPFTDMSELKKGDLVEVEVRFFNKPLSVSAQGMEFITAHSAGFGQSDGFSLFSYLIDGKAQFRVQCPGQWMINVYHKQDVTRDGPLKDLFGKAQCVYHAATLTFTAR